MLSIPVTIIVWVLFVSTLILFTIVIWLREKLQKEEDRYIQLADKDDFFESTISILRSDELELFNVLKTVIGENYYIFPQVHLSEMIEIKNVFKDHKNLYEILGNKSVDFGVFTKNTLRPLLAIELNGSSHLLSGTLNRDALKKSIFKKVGIEYISLEKGNYKFNEVIVDIRNKLRSAEKN